MSRLVKHAKADWLSSMLLVLSIAMYVPRYSEQFSAHEAGEVVVTAGLCVYGGVAVLAGMVAAVRHSFLIAFLAIAWTSGSIVSLIVDYYYVMV